MPNLLDYLKWRGDLSFAVSPLNEVDNLILSEISYLNLSDEVPADFSHPVTLQKACSSYFQHSPNRKSALGLIIPDGIQDLAAAAALSARFGGIELVGFRSIIDREQEEQFAALTYLLDEQTAYCAYRGTDDTLVGWKENFNMSFLFPVPAQRDAAVYLDEAVQSLASRKLFVGGHSKGGNLAVYAAARCCDKTRDCILHVYNNDGPGFPTSEITAEHHNLLTGRLTTLMPQQSVVGILLQRDANIRVVQSSGTGPIQHDGLTWQVLGTSFRTAQRLSQYSRRKESTLRAWIANMDNQQRKDFVEHFFAFLHTTDATTLTELAKHPENAVRSIRTALDKPTRDVLFHSLRLLMREQRNELSNEVEAALSKAAAAVFAFKDEILK